MSRALFGLEPVPVWNPRRSDERLEVLVLRDLSGYGGDQRPFIASWRCRVTDRGRPITARALSVTVACHISAGRSLEGRRGDPVRASKRRASHEPTCLFPQRHRCFRNHILLRTRQSPKRLPQRVTTREQLASLIAKLTNRHRPRRNPG